MGTYQNAAVGTFLAKCDENSMKEYVSPLYPINIRLLILLGTEFQVHIFKDFTAAMVQIFSVYLFRHL